MSLSGSRCQAASAYCAQTLTTLIGPGVLQVQRHIDSVAEGRAAEVSAACMFLHC